METTPEVIAIAKEVRDAWGTSLSGGRTMSIERALGITKMVLHLAEATTVRTVGDLTARHIGKRVRVAEYEGPLDAVFGFGGRCSVSVDMGGFTGGGMYDLDTPIEVLP